AASPARRSSTRGTSADPRKPGKPVKKIVATGAPPSAQTGNPPQRPEQVGHDPARELTREAAWYRQRQPVLDGDGLAFGVPQDALGAVPSTKPRLLEAAHRRIDGCPGCRVRVVHVDRAGL